MATNESSAPGDNDTIAVVKVEGHNNVAICQGSGSTAQATTSAVGMYSRISVAMGSRCRSRNFQRDRGTL